MDIFGKKLEKNLLFQCFPIENPKKIHYNG